MRPFLAFALLVGLLQGQAAVSPKARDAAIVRGMGYLDENLWKDQIQGSPYKQYTAAVAGWAYCLASDDQGQRLPGRRKHLDRIRGYLVRYTKQIARLYEHDDRRSKRRRQKPQRKTEPSLPDGLEDFTPRESQYVWPLAMVGHMFAERLARHQGTTEAKAVLRQVVQVLEAAQQPNGGWGHDDAARPGMGLPKIRIPKPWDKGGTFDYPGTLLAASSCALSGLGVACRQLGKKPGKTLAAARKYFARAQNGDGTFPYDPSQRHDLDAKTAAMMGGIEVARTPGVLFALCCAGRDLTDPVVRKAARAIDRNPELTSEGHGSATMALQFGALASRTRGGEAWQTYRRIFFPRILAAQQADGSFDCAAAGKSVAVTDDTRPLPGMHIPGLDENRRLYVTAIHVLILMLDRAEPRAMLRLKAVAQGPTTPRRSR